MGEADAGLAVASEAGSITWRLGEEDSLVGLEVALEVSGDEVFAAAVEAEVGF